MCLYAITLVVDYLPLCWYLVSVCILREECCSFVKYVFFRLRDDAYARGNTIFDGVEESAQERKKEHKKKEKVTFQLAYQ